MKALMLSALKSTLNKKNINFYQEKWNQSLKNDIYNYTTVCAMRNINYNSDWI